MIHRNEGKHHPAAICCEQHRDHPQWATLPISFYSRTECARHTKTPSGDGAIKDAPRPQWKQPFQMALRSKGLDPVHPRYGPDKTQSRGSDVSRHQCRPCEPQRPQPDSPLRPWPRTRPLTAAQVQDPPSRRLSKYRKNAKFLIGTGMERWP